MKLTPASRALATIRAEIASSVGPPNIMVPRQIGEIFRPLRPRLRYCIGWVLFVLAPSPRTWRGEGWGEGLSQRAQLAESPPHPALRADLSPHAGRGKGRLRPSRYASLFNILNTPLAMAIQRLSTVTSVLTKIRLRVERTTRGFDTSVSPILPASTKWVSS